MHLASSSIDVLIVESESEIFAIFLLYVSLKHVQFIQCFTNVVRFLLVSVSNPRGIVIRLVSANYCFMSFCTSDFLKRF